MNERELLDWVFERFDNDDFCDQGCSCGDCEGCDKYNEIAITVKKND